MKPSFVAPSQTLEKSLRDQMRSSGSSSSPPAKSSSASSASGLDLGHVSRVDEGDPNALPITDEEKSLRLAKEPEDFSLDGRPFLKAVFNALDCGETDYVGLYALCLIYAMQQNKGDFLLAPYLDLFVPWCETLLTLPPPSFSLACVLGGFYSLLERALHGQK